jgi:hypothetical protein
MAITLTAYPHPNGSDNTQRHQIIFGTATITGTYVTGGLVITWGNLSDVLQNAPNPVWAEFISAAGAYTYNYSYNVTTKALRIYAPGGTELTNGGTITADTIEFRAEFVRGVN